MSQQQRHLPPIGRADRKGQGSTGKCNAPHVGERPCLSFAAYGVEFVVEILRCRAPLHRSTSDSHRHAPDVELYTALQRSPALQLYSALHSTSSTPPPSAGPAATATRPRRPARLVLVLPLRELVAHLVLNLSGSLNLTSPCSRLWGKKNSLRSNTQVHYGISENLAVRGLPSLPWINNPASSAVTMHPTPYHPAKGTPQRQHHPWRVTTQKIPNMYLIKDLTRRSRWRSGCTPRPSHASLSPHSCFRSARCRAAHRAERLSADARRALRHRHGPCKRLLGTTARPSRRRVRIGSRLVGPTLRAGRRPARARCAP